MHQDRGIEQRTCKHLRAYLGDAAETQRLGAAALSGPPPKPARPAGESDAQDDPSPPLLLAQKWDNELDLTGWWVSEKLDGVRAYWDGTQFISRLGNKFFAPAWFTEKLPATPLDGELWGGRKRFQRTVGIVKRQDESDLWRELSYQVFDAPAHGGVFEERLDFIALIVQASNVDWLQAHPHSRCEGTHQLRAELARVEGLGGEGLMVRQPQSRYEAGRSNTLIKLKSFHDAEARVLAHVPGAGRHKGRLGALLVELEDGTPFNVGTGFSDAQRNHPPAIGSIITFRYQELSDAGVPRFPSYVGERIDGQFHRPPSRAGDTPAPPSSLTREKPMTLRRFEMTEADTRYFWEIETQGLSQTIRFGTFDQKRNVFEDTDEARSNTAEKIADKLGKGFVEVTSDSASARARDPFEDKEQKASQAVPAPKAPLPAVPAAPAREDGARYFELIEGTAAKFWEIRVDGVSFFTRYGKIGTQGQMTQKDFSSEAKAQAEADKLITEKTKKGYTEQ